MKNSSFCTGRVYFVVISLQQAFIFISCLFIYVLPEFFIRQGNKGSTLRATVSMDYATK